MILHALADYYQRKPKAGEGYAPDGDAVAPVGMEENAISFVIVIDRQGRFINLGDVRIEGSRNRPGSPTIVPMSADRTGTDSWRTAFLLWDHPRYVLGLPKAGESKYKGLKRLAVFIRAIRRAFPDPGVDAGVAAVLSFYARRGENFPRLRAHGRFADLEGGNGNITFQLADEPGDYVCQSAVVRERTKSLFENDPAAPKGQCLISGEMTSIQVLHPATSIAGSKATAKLIGFNARAFESYGKRERRGENAPVGKRAAFAYTTALNHLLRFGGQNLRICADTYVFWADRKSDFEGNFADLYADDPARGIPAVKALLVSAEQGVGPVLDDKTRFFVLGLAAPSLARITIRSWHVGTVAEMAGHIVRHFRDIEIDPPLERNKEPPFLSLRRLLLSIAPASAKHRDGDPEKVSPNLGGEVMRAILEETSYPETLFHGAIRRIRAGEPVGYPRAAILKACLNRTRNSSEEKIKMSLDPSNTHPGYRLGRLFAVLERIQEEAAGGHGKINATIRDRFYGAASSTPATVFPLLLRLKNHHLAKIDNVGRRRNLESLIGEIIRDLPQRFEPHLSMDGQGRFAVGYYQQRVHPSTYGKQGD